MEAWIFGDCFIQSSHEGVDPAWTIDACKIRYTLNGSSSDRRNSIFQIVGEKRLKMLKKELGILHFHSQISYVAN